jgi:hypothetical protein
MIVATAGAAATARTTALVGGAGHHPARPRGRRVAAAELGATIAITTVAAATAAGAARTTAAATGTTATRALARVTTGARGAQAAEAAARGVAAGSATGPATATATAATTTAAAFTPTTAASIAIVTPRTACAGPRHHVDRIIEIAPLLHALHGLVTGEHAHETHALRTLAGHRERFHQARQAITGDVQSGADRVGNGSSARGGLFRGRGRGGFGAGAFTFVAGRFAVGAGRFTFGTGRFARASFGRCLDDVGRAFGDLRGFGHGRVAGAFDRGSRGVGCLTSFGWGSDGSGFIPLHGRANTALDVGGLTEQSSSKFGDRLHNPPLGRALGRVLS